MRARWSAPSRFFHPFAGPERGPATDKACQT
jgi:hypothetical protein